jgi:hypothetical protein
MESVMKYSDCKTIKDKESFIKDKLINDWDWTKRGLVAIYNKQSWDEKVSPQARHDNGVGFTHTDAKFLSAMAQRILNDMYFSDKMRICTIKAMRKYAGQLRKIADNKI